MGDAPKKDNYGRYPTWAICFFLARIIRGPYFGTVIGGPCKEGLFNHSYENTGESYGPYQTPQGL